MTTTRRKKSAEAQSNKAVGYIRVSTSHQAEEGVSLDAQTKRIGSYCETHGLDLVRIVQDPEAISGGIPLHNREGGAEVLRMIAAGEVSQVVALKLDRLFRSAKDCLTHIENWQEKGVSLHLVDMGGQSVNSGSGPGKLFVTMLAGFAEFERKLISERTEAALRHKRETGRVYSAVTPYGYQRKEDRLVPVEAEQKVIAKMKLLRSRGKSLHQIAAKLNEDNIATRKGGKWHASTVTYIIDSDRIAKPPAGTTGDAS